MLWDSERKQPGGQAELTRADTYAGSPVTRDPAAADHASLEGLVLGRGRFQIIRPLGSGGMGEVYEAHDNARGHSVALKHLVRIASPGGFALKAEFRSLAGVEHTNVVRLYEMFCEDDPWFFTMELVQGVDLVHYVRGGGSASNAVTLPSAGELTGDQAAWPIVPISAERLSAVLVQLVHGLSAIHAAGKLHCDIKPSNVVVSPEGRLVILDFGLVTDTNEDSSHRDVWVAGTPGYIAPERFAGHRATEACDWYAVGVVLHESLTGRLPSPSRSREGQLQVSLVDSSTSQQAELARLEAICAGLLDPDPHLRWKGDQVLAMLGAPAARGRASAPPAQRATPSQRFVGRELELSRLHEAMAVVRGGSAAVVCIGGESGIGKTALVTQFVSQGRSMPRALILQSRCYERESVRYKTFDGVMDQLSAFWSRLPEAEAAAILPRGVGSLAQVFGVLRQVPAVGTLPVHKGGEAPDPRERRIAAFRALKELLARISDRYLLIITIDDLQWGDAESADEIVQLLSPPDAPSVLLVGAYRSTDLRDGSPLHRLLQALRQCSVHYQEIAVSPLNDHEVSALASSLSEQRLAHATLRRISEESKGSPFFVNELVRHTSRQGELALVHTGDLVHLRIAELSATDQHLLELIAVAPGPVKQRVLREASGLGNDLELAVSNLLSEGLIRSRRGEAYDLLEPYHDRIREAIINHLPADTKRAHHETFVRVLRDGEDESVEVIAAHLEGSGRPASASQYYALAAEQARNALAFDHAAQLYEKSVALCPPGEGDPTLLMRLAEVLAFAGQGPRSARAYMRAAADAKTDERDELQLRAAEQFLYAGHHVPATGILRELLPKLGVRLPSGPRWLVLLQVLYNAVWIFVSMFRAPRPSRDATESARRAQICETLGDGLLYVNLEVFAYLQQQHVLSGLKASEPGSVALALTSRALLLASPFPHLFHLALPDLDRAVELSRTYGDPYVRGRVLLNRAVVYSAAGRYAETIALARQAELVFRRDCQGIKWGLQHSIAWQSVALFFLGRFRELDELCREHLPEARRRGDEMLTKLLAIWSAWVAVARDDPEEALRSGPVSPDEISHDAFTVLDAGTLTQRGPLLLYLGRIEEAWELYRRCEPQARRTGVLTARARAHDFHWTRGLVATHLLREDGDASARRKIERTLQRDLRKLRSSRTDDALAMAEHLEGNLLLVQGKRSLAIERLSAAARHYAAMDMRAWEEVMRLAVATLGGNVDAPKESARAREALRDCGVGSPERWLALWCPEAARAAIESPSVAAPAAEVTAS